MITIRYDFQQTQQIGSNGNIWLANQIKDYVPLRQHLRQALNDRDHNYVIYIQSRILAHWLDDLRDYGPNVIRWEEVNLREEFRHKFGFLPPSDFDDQAIRDLQLLNLPLPDDQTFSDPVGWLLGRCIDRVWSYQAPYKGHLADLAAWALNAKQISSSFIPSLKKRLSQWIEIDSRYQLFFESPWYKAGESLMLRWALRNYPLQFSLREQLDSVPLVDCSRFSKLCLDLLNNHASELRNFWNSWFATNNSHDITYFMKTISGLADVELSIFESWANEHSDALTDTILESANDLFSSLPKAKLVLRQLVQLIPPLIPDKPEDYWTLDQWLNWATEKYMPYFTWVIRNRQQRDLQMQLSQCFSDWLINSYPKFLFDHNAPTITNQKHQVLDSRSSNQADVVLWFIIDGLTWWQGRKLSNICFERGLGITKFSPSISAVPSITSISKRALVQGSLNPTYINQSISQLLYSLLVRDTVNAHVYTQHHDLEINMRTNLEKGIYVLFYNALDHQSHESRGFTDDESTDGHLNLIAQLVEKGFQQGLKQGLNVKAFISSDHGSTILPSEGFVLSVPNFAQPFEGEEMMEDEATDKTQKSYVRTRVCAIESEPKENSLKQVAQDWYLLRKNVFNLPLDFLIPKGYAAVGRRPHGWTHGGASPEETIIPFIELQPSPFQVLSPTIDTDDYLMPNRVKILTIKLTNPNPFPLKNVRLFIVDKLVNTEIGVIEPTRQFVTKFEASPPTSKGTTQIFRWMLTCDVNGQPSRFDGELEVRIRRLQVSEVDELFEDL